MNQYHSNLIMIQPLVKKSIELIEDYSKCFHPDDAIEYKHEYFCIIQTELKRIEDLLNTCNKIVENHLIDLEKDLEIVNELKEFNDINNNENE